MRWRGPTSASRSGTTASWSQQWRTATARRSAWPTCWASEFIVASRPVALDLGALRVTGRAGMPDAARARADQQYVYVNGRYVRDKADRARRALSAYEDVLHGERQPVYVLFIEIAPDAGRRQRAPDQDRGALPRQPRGAPGGAARGRGDARGAAAAARRQRRRRDRPTPMPRRRRCHRRCPTFGRQQSFRAARRGTAAVVARLAERAGAARRAAAPMQRRDAGAATRRRRRRRDLAARPRDRAARTASTSWPRTRTAWSSSTCTRPTSASSTSA